MSYRLRPLAAPDDYDALAVFLTRLTGEETTAGKMREADERRPKGTLLHRQVAVDAAGAIVAALLVGTRPGEL